MSGQPPSGEASSWRDRLVATALVCGFLILAIGAFVVPRGRNRLSRDPVADALTLLREVQIGQPRKVVESRLRNLDLRSGGGVEVFQHPDTDQLRIEIVFSGPGQDDPVIAVGPPYLAQEPRFEPLYGSVTAAGIIRR